MVLAERPEGALEVAELERRFLGGGNRVFRDRRLVERHIARMVLAALIQELTCSASVDCQAQWV